MGQSNTDCVRKVLKKYESTPYWSRGFWKVLNSHGKGWEWSGCLKIQRRQLRVQGVPIDSWLSLTNSPSYFLGAICPISKQFPKPTKLGQFNVAK